MKKGLPNCQKIGKRVRQNLSAILAVALCSFGWIHQGVAQCPAGVVYIAEVDSDGINGSAEQCDAGVAEYVQICFEACAFEGPIDISGWELEDAVSNDGNPMTTVNINSGSLQVGECVTLVSDLLEDPGGDVTGTMGSIINISADRDECPVWNNGGDEIYLYNGDSQAGATLIDSETYNTTGTTTFAVPVVNCCVPTTLYFGTSTSYPGSAETGTMTDPITDYNAANGGLIDVINDMGGCVIVEFLDCAYNTDGEFGDINFTTAPTVDCVTFNGNGAIMTNLAASSAFLRLCERDGWTFNDFTFTGWNGTDGGAFGIYGSTNIAFNNVIFDSNPTTTPLHIDVGDNFTCGFSDASVTITGCIFSNNPPGAETVSTGGLEIEHTASSGSTTLDVDIIDTDFLCNARQGMGGGLTIQNDNDMTLNVSIIGGTFAGNHGDANAGDGGAIYVEGENTLLGITNTLFSCNTTDASVGESGGGAIRIFDGPGVVIDNSTFYGNTSADNGGAIHFTTVGAGGVLGITNTIFADNTAASDGGAIYLEGGTVSAFIDVLFVNNMATNSGGGIFMETGSILGIEDHTFTGNTPDDIADNGTLTDFGGISTLTDPMIMACASCVVPPPPGSCEASSGDINLTDECLFLCSEGENPDGTALGGQAFDLTIDNFVAPCANPTDYTYVFLVVNSSGQIVAVIDAADGDADGTPDAAEGTPQSIDLTGFAPGDYVIHGFHYLTADADIQAYLDSVDPDFVNPGDGVVGDLALPTGDTDLATTGTALADLLAETEAGGGTGCGEISPVSADIIVLEPIIIDLEITCIGADPGEFLVSLTISGGLPENNGAGSYDVTSNVGGFAGSYTFGTPITDVAVVYMMGATVDVSVTADGNEVNNDPPDACDACVAMDMIAHMDCATCPELTALTTPGMICSGDLFDMDITHTADPGDLQIVASTDAPADAATVYAFPVISGGITPASMVTMTTATGLSLPANATATDITYNVCVTLDAANPMLVDPDCLPFFCTTVVVLPTPEGEITDGDTMDSDGDMDHHTVTICSGQSASGTFSLVAGVNGIVTDVTADAGVMGVSTAVDAILADGATIEPSALTNMTMADAVVTYTICAYNSGSDGLDNSGTGDDCVADGDVNGDTDNGMSSCVTYQITVQPSLMVTCPDPDLGTFECLSDVPAAATTEAEFEMLTGADIGDDFCGTLTISSVDMDNSGAGCPGDQLIITRTYTISDDQNMETCDQTITVENTMPPAFDQPVPNDTMIDCTEMIPDAAELTATGGCAGAGGDLVMINEIHYDNASGDVGEFMEIAGTAGFDLSTCSLELYNGNNGQLYNTVALTGVIPDEGDGYGAVSFPVAGIQNGSPDGVALICGGTVLEFLSYEGSFTAADGTAVGATSTDIGVSEPGSTAIGMSVQRTDTANVVDDFTWAGPLAESPGFLNDGQLIEEPDGIVVTFNETTLPGACASQDTIMRIWSAGNGCGSTVQDTQFIYLIDDSQPTFVAPMDTTIDCDVWAADNASAGMVTDVMEACSMASVSIVDMGQLDGCGGYTGVITRMWTVEDDCGNDTTFNQIITVQDTTPPTFTVPVDACIGLADDSSDLTLTGDVTDAMDNCTGVTPTILWINEFHYDDISGDDGEFFEIAGTASTDLTGYSIVLYNGANGLTYNTIALTGLIPDEGLGFGALSFLQSNIQNGSPDGIALVNPGGTVLEFISYEGSFEAVNGPASGQMSMDILVAEGGATPEGQSLQKIGTGNTGMDFTWSGPSLESPGVLNNNQTITPLPAPSLVVVDYMDVEDLDADGVGTITRTWTVTDDCDNESVQVQEIKVISCAITAITAGAAGTCDPVTNTYSQEIIVEYLNIALDTLLDVSIEGTSVASYAATGSPQTILLSGLDADGEMNDITVSSVDTTGIACDFTVADLYTAPAFCGPCEISAVTIGATGLCDPVTNTYTQELIIEYNAAIIAGTMLDISIGGYMTSVAATASPQAVTVIGIPADGSTVDVTVTNSLDAACTITVAGAVTAPTSCTPCEITGITAGATGECDDQTNLYTQSLTITYTDIPAGTDLEISFGGFSTTVAATASPQDVDLVDLASDGALNSVTVSGVNASGSACTLTVDDLFTSPEACILDCVLTCPGDVIINLEAGECQESAVVLPATIMGACGDVVTPFPAVADFVGDFDFANNVTNGAVHLNDDCIDETGLPTVLVLESADVVSGGNTCPGFFTAVAYIVPADGTISFDWDWAIDDVPGFDDFGYYLGAPGGFTYFGNAAFTVIQDPFVGDQSGSSDISVEAGQEFIFLAFTVDGIGGPGVATITNFVFAPAPLVETYEVVQSGGPLNGEFLDPGVYEVVFDLLFGGAVDTSCSYMITINEYAGPVETDLSCNHIINVSIDADCMATIRGDDLLEGGPYMCYDDYIITIDGIGMDGVDVNGVAINLPPGTDLIAQITDPNTGNNCWTTLHVEYKFPPELMCPCEPVNLSLDVDLGAASPTYQRTNSGGGATCNLAAASTYPYAVLPLSFSNAGTYTFTASGAGDLYGTLYAGSFDPSNPCTNYIEDDDDAAGSLDPEIIRELDAGEYVLVTSTFGSAGVGEVTVTWTITAELEGCDNTCEDFDAFIADPTLGGAPAISGGCTQVNDYTFTDVISSGSVCDDKTVTRTFEVTDNLGNTTSCVTTYNFIATGSFDFPENLDGIANPALDCSESCANSNTGWAYQSNPDYPGLKIPSPDAAGNCSGSGRPGGSGCDFLQSTYWDHILPVCDLSTGGPEYWGTYKVVRHWIVSNWCTGEVSEMNQLIKVEDTTPPVVTCPDDITVGVTGHDCDRDLMRLPYPDVQDDCGHGFATPGVVTADGEEIAPGARLYQQGADWFVVDLPWGDNVIWWIATDGCNNYDTCDYTITVEDLTPPVPVCESFRQVSLTSDGLAKIFAASFDDGSNDNCGPVYFKVRRNIIGECDRINGDDSPAGGYQEWYDDYVKFCCEDVGEPVRVTLRVYDVDPGPGPIAPGAFAGHWNECWSEVTVEDKLPPAISCPPDQTVSCDNDLLISDLDNNNVDNPYGYAVGLDNCHVDITVRASEPVDCGVDGRFFTRTFTATDPDGRTARCTQRIYLEEDPFIICDTESRCEPLQSLGTVCANGGHTNRDNAEWPCDLVLGECGLGLDPWQLDANPANARDLNGNRIALNAYPRYDNAGSNLNGRILGEYPYACAQIAIDSSDQVFTIVEDACLKILRTWTVIDWCQFDAITRDPDDPDRFVGYWEYIQIIKVRNSTGPEFEDPGQTDFCDEDTPNCLVDVSLSSGATDDCTPADQLHYAWAVDYHNDGSYDLTGNGANFNRGVEAGTHTIRWTVEDGCGNEEITEYEFTARECKKPTPYCDNGIAIVVMPSSGSIAVWANDLDAGSFDNCTEQEDLVFTIRKVVDGEPIGNPTPSLTLDCECIPNGVSETINVEIWVTDESGNTDNCNTYILLQDTPDADMPEGVCPDEDVVPLVGGTIATEEGISAQGHEVQLLNAEGQAIETDFTNAAGDYAFVTLEGASVRPVNTLNVSQGLNTLDLLGVQRHILGMETFTSPYKMIAANVTNDAAINVLDLLQIQEVILGLRTEFANIDSWVYVSTEEEMDVNNPYNYESPKTIPSYTDQDNIVEDFVAVKAGDVDGTAISFGQVIERSGLVLDVDVTKVTYGDEVRVPVTSRNFKSIDGYQFTLDFDQSVLEFVGIESGALTINPENVGIHSSGKIATNWYDVQAQTVSADQVLFTLVLRGESIESLQINGDVTSAESYSNGQIKSVNLALGGQTASAFALHQNEPNPFAETTTVMFDLPSAAAATLTVFDVNGKTLMVRDIEATAGYNESVIKRSDINNATGVMYYRVDTDDYSATKKMISMNK